MTDTRQFIPVAGLLGTIAFATYMVVQLHAQGPVTSSDFTNAGRAEVRDAQGQALLTGSFAPADEEDDDIERKARLEPTGVDTDAAGEAEVEFARAAPAEQEVEFSVRNLEPNTAITFVIDGVEVSMATTDRRGRAEIELDIPIPGTGAAR